MIGAQLLYRLREDKVRVGVFFVNGVGWLHFQALRYEAQGKLLTTSNLGVPTHGCALHADPEVICDYPQCLENIHLEH